MNELTPEIRCAWCDRPLTDDDSFVMYELEGFHNQPQRGDTEACISREIASRTTTTFPTVEEPTRA